MKAKYYLFSILISLGGGIASALITMKDMALYQEITKPPLAPPAIVFPIVWTALYVLMGISAARVFMWKNAEPRLVEKALTRYAISLIVNYTWPIFFFTLSAFAVALIWLILLFVLVIMTIIVYKKIDKAAAYLQIPYVIWLLIAAYLNAAILILN